MMKSLAVFTLLLFFSCTDKKNIPKGIIPPEKMQAVFWDYMRTDVYTTDFIKRDTSKIDSIENIKLQNKVFNYYHISRETFYRSYTYYLDHADLMNVLMDSILAKQNRAKFKTRAKEY